MSVFSKILFFNSSFDLRDIPCVSVSSGIWLCLTVFPQGVFLQWETVKWFQNSEFLFSFYLHVSSVCQTPFTAKNLMMFSFSKQTGKQTNGVLFLKAQK